MKKENWEKKFEKQSQELDRKVFEGLTEEEYMTEKHWKEVKTDIIGLFFGFLVPFIIFILLVFLLNKWIY